VIPDDSSLSEDVFIISFRASGRWSISVWLERDIGSFTSFVTDQFDVGRGSHEIISPLEYIPTNREFAPLAMPVGRFVSPQASAIVLDSLTFRVTATFTVRLNLTLRPINGRIAVFPAGVSSTDTGGERRELYEFSVSTPGNYCLLMFPDSRDSVELFS
jgi:hypothetical protein